VKYEVAEAKFHAVLAWGKRAWAWVRKAIGFLSLAAMVVILPWFVWKLFTDPQTRHTAGTKVVYDLKWWIIFGIASWVLSKIFRKKASKPTENESGNQPSVQGSESESHRTRRKGKNNRRVQRGH
jgi:hypothetical protein